MNDQKRETRPHIGQEQIDVETLDDPADLDVEFVPAVIAPQAVQAIDPNPNPLSMLASALQQGHDVDKLGKLMDLAERYEANEARKAFATALSKFQATCLR